jgi:hypothetical protein
MTMHQLLLTLALILRTSLLPADYQKFVLDDKYNNVQPKGATTKPLVYKVKAGSKGFILDCSHYNFTEIRKMNNNVDPDAIHIVCKAGTFDVHLNITGQTVIDASTMHSLKDEEVFKAFQKGDHIILGIGTTIVAGGTAKMNTYWVTLMDVD